MEQFIQWFWSLTIHEDFKNAVSHNELPIPRHVAIGGVLQPSLSDPEQEEERHTACDLDLHDGIINVMICMVMIYFCFLIIFQTYDLHNYES